MTNQSNVGTIIDIKENPAAKSAQQLAMNGVRHYDGYNPHFFRDLEYRLKREERGEILSASVPQNGKMRKLNSRQQDLMKAFNLQLSDWYKYFRKPQLQYSMAAFSSDL